MRSCAFWLASDWPTRNLAKRCRRRHWCTKPICGWWGTTTTRAGTIVAIVVDMSLRVAAGQFKLGFDQQLLNTDQVERLRQFGLLPAVRPVRADIDVGHAPLAQPLAGFESQTQPAVRILRDVRLVPQRPKILKLDRLDPSSLFVFTLDCLEFDSQLDPQLQ